MGLKKYILGSLLFVALLGGYIWTIEPSYYEFMLFGVNINIPIALWMMLPTTIIIALSILHIAFYGIKQYFNDRAIQSDQDAITEATSDLLLSKSAKFNFKTEVFKDIGAVLSQLNIGIKNSDFYSTSKMLNETADKILRIQNGKYISIKELDLPNDNKIAQQNLLNKVEFDPNFCLNILKDSSSYPSEIVQKSIIKAIETKELSEFKEYCLNAKMSKENIKLLLKKDSVLKENDLSHDEIAKLIQEAKFDISDYIEIINWYKFKMIPDSLIKLFEELSVLNDASAEAYLYVLFEFEMLDDVRAFLVGSRANEFKVYKALLDLKDAGKKYTINDTIHLK